MDDQRRVIERGWRWLELITVVVAVIGLYFIYQELGLTRKAVEASVRQSELAAAAIDRSTQQFEFSQRAYLILKDVIGERVKTQAPPMDLVGLRAEFVNTGQSPAQVTSSEICADFVPAAEVANVPSTCTERETHAKMIGPGERFSRACLSDIRGKDSLWARSTVLVVRGRVQYSDLFDKEREVRFCRVLNPGPKHLDRPIWEPCTGSDGF